MRESTSYKGFVRSVSLVMLTPLFLSSLLFPTIVQGQTQEEKFPFDAEVSLGGGVMFDRLEGSIDPRDVNGLTDSSNQAGSYCGNFNSGSGFGLILVPAFSYSPFKPLWLEGSASVARRTSTLSFECVDPARIRLSDGSTTMAITEHSLELERVDLLLGVGVRFHPIKDLGLYLGFRGEAIISLSGKYQLHEDIVTPTSAVFVDGGGQRREYGSGNLESSSGMLAGSFRLGYDLLAGEHFMLRSEIGYRISFTSELQEESLRSNALMLSLHALYRFTLIDPHSSTPLDPGDEVRRGR